MKVWRRALTLLVAVAMLFGVTVGPGAAPSSAVVDLATAQVDLKVLLVTDSTTYPSYGAWVALLDREGVPYDVFNQASDTLEYADLASGDHAFYQGVVCATRCTDILEFGSASMGDLETFLADFQLRLVHGFAPPDPIFGLSNEDGNDQVVDGDVLTVTSAGAAVFPYLDGTVVIDEFTNGFYPSIVDPSSYTPFFLEPGGSPVLGVHADPLGFDEMVMTVNSNEYQSHALLLGHGMLHWVTNGLYMGYNRNYFTAHIDDIFLPDDRWDVEDNMTYEDGCVANTCIRLVPSDVTRLLDWQSSTGIRLDMVFNGAGSDEAIADNGSDPLTDALLAVRDQLYWINHTYEHINLNTVSQAVIEDEIQSNIAFAAANDITIDPFELVTGEHSGLRRDLPPITAENPNLAPALTAKGIVWVAADNSVDPVPYTIGSATTIPRYPANVYYNVGTEVEQLDEYNYIYTLPPVGDCENTAATTCNAIELTWEEYVDVEASIMLPHLVTNDPRPHYFHQSNLAEDGVLYTVVGEVLDRYNSYFKVPLIQPLFSEAGEIMDRKAAWDAGRDAVTAYLQAGAVHLSAPTTIEAPLTGVPIVGDLYGTERSGWITIGPAETILDWTPPVITLAGTTPIVVNVGDVYVDAGATAVDNVDLDLTTSIVTVNPVNTAVPGPYTVTYNVADAAGNPAAEVTRTVNVVDVTAPVLTLTGANPQLIEQTMPYFELGATAIDNADGDITGSIVIGTGTVDTQIPGDYVVTYDVADAAGNPSHASRTVRVLAMEAPFISLIGDNPQLINAGSPYVELGATAVDNVDGDLTGSVVIDASTVDTAVVGQYVVTYNVTDAAGNAALPRERTVNVVDYLGPVVTLTGDNPQVVALGNPYVELGATAVDDLDGDVSDSITIDTSGLNLSVPGRYAVIYAAKDSSGNISIGKTRIVDVVDYFIDDDGSIFQRDINAIALAGITKGCNPPLNDRFCPEFNATRGQFAAMISRAFGLTVEADDPFVDDDDSIFEGDIERLYAAGITKGCNPPDNDEYCPDRPLTRGEAAAMFVRAFGYTDDGGGDLFIDDDDSVFEGDIDRLATAGVTKGCNPSEGNTKFCPGRLINRGEIAAFIARALGL